MRFIICDGSDNCGKSGVIKRICDFCEKCGVRLPTILKFPSAEIFQTEVARRLFGDGDESARATFVDMIVAEARKEILRVIELKAADPETVDDDVFVDRLFVSTLVYQGSGAEGGFEAERIICEKYDVMFKEIGIDPRDVYHYVFVYPLKSCDKGETDPLKLKLDAKTAIHVNRTIRLIEAIRTGAVKSEYLRNLTVFNEGEHAYRSGEGLSDEEIDDIQKRRANQILYTHLMCGGV